MFDSGTLIAGRYVIQSPLASGGSGLVYSALDRTTEKRVAIKILGQHVMHERAAREKLRLEAIVAGRVESENVVQVSDAGVDPASGYPFLVMELLKGSDLQHWVEKHGPPGTSAAFEILRQVAAGLDKSHTWKDDEQRTVPIVHRDLKPENLFLTHREDGTPLVKILDFGLAKVLSGSATLSSEVRGTPLYMAPEQLSQRPVTPATDIWAFGLIAFFLLTGRCYWKAGQNSNVVLPAVLKEVSDGPPVGPLERLAEFGSAQILPSAFDEWFLRCVNLEPTARFQSAGEAVRALGRALDVPEKSSPLTSINSISIPSQDPFVQNDIAGTPSRDSVPAVVAVPPTKRHRLYRVAVAVAVLGFVLLFIARARIARPLAAASSTASSAKQSLPERPKPPEVPSTIANESAGDRTASATPPPDATRDSATPPKPGSSSAPSFRAARSVASGSRASSSTPRSARQVRPLASVAPQPEPSTAPRTLKDPADHR